MEQPRPSVEQAVERLAAAYRGEGVGRLRAPGRGVSRVLADVRREIAPLRLPEELERFWRLVDPESVTVAPYPRLTSPAFALRSWVMHRDESPGMTPRLLFPVACESHGFLFAELEDGTGQGGAVYEWGYGGSRFLLRFGGVAGYLDLLATMVELGELRRHDSGWIEVDPDRRWADAAAVRLAAADLPPRVAAAADVDDDPRTWPEHWLRSSGLDAEVRTPRGRTTTVAELLRRAASGEARGTIHGTVTRLAGSGAGCRISVDDGTGELDVWCPAAICAFGPVIRRRFELDVVARHAAPPPDWSSDQRRVQDDALVGSLEAAQAAAMDLYATAFQTTAAAEATAVRPLD